MQIVLKIKTINNRIKKVKTEKRLDKNKCIIPIPCSRRFFVAMHLEKLPVAGSVSIVSKDIRNPLSLPAHNKAALQLIRRVSPPDTSKFLFIY